MFQHHFKPDYKEKYLKYKNKYNNLKKQFGSAAVVSEDYEYGDWEHIYDLNNAINYKFKELGYPLNKLNDVLYLNPKTDNLELISDIIVYESKKVSDDKVLADIDITKSLIKIQDFFKAKDITSEKSREKKDEIIKNQNLKKIQDEERELRKREAEAAEIARKQEIAEIERLERERLARQAEAAEKARKDEIEARKAEIEDKKAEIIRIKQVAEKAKIESEDEKQEITKECNKINNYKVCNRNVNCYYHHRDKKCKPSDEALKNITDRLSAISEVKQYKIMKLEEEKKALNDKKSRFYHECKEFNKNEAECNLQQIKGRRKCYFDPNTGNCIIHKTQLQSINSNLQRINRSINQ
jgi:hypothetical protein